MSTIVPRQFLIFFCLLLSAFAPVASGADDAWALPLKGAEYGAFFDVTLAGSTVVAVGTTNHRHVPPYEGDALLVWVDLEGNVLSERTWGGDGYEQAWGIEAAPDGGLYIFGETSSRGAGSRDFFLLRTDADGDEVWSTTYGTPGREWPFGMLLLRSGNLFLYGRTDASSGRGEDRYAVCVGPDGRVLWEHTAPSELDEIIVGAVEAEDGALVLSLSYGQDPKLIRLTEQGEVVWEIQHELPGWQFGSSIAQMPSGDFLLAGFSMASSGSRQADVWLSRLTSAGDLLWERSFGRPTEDDYAQSLLRTSDGAYVIGGLGNGLPLFKVNEAGEVLWEARPAGSNVYAAQRILELEDGSLVVAALEQVVPGRSYDALLLRVDEQGRLDR